ncbi:MAG: gliding motility-associated C-terminal domain-containing protein [Paludibacteraceae bacterium]|nr:gliding motility-associated C-terminal domain-containing protein [Paludibacteraceae bacterium]
MLAIGNFKRYLAFSLLTVLSIFRASATLTLTPDVKESCPSEAIVLTCASTTDITGHYLVYEYSYSPSGPWTYASSMTRLKKIAVDFPDDQEICYYRVSDAQTGETSAVTSVSRSTSSDCAVTCNQTTTGEYYLGTDFDPLTPGGQGSIPDGVQSHFGDHHIAFDKGGVGDYKIISDLTSEFGGNVHIDDSLGVAGKNYYYFFENPNTSVVTLSFDPKYVCGQSYRYTMRLYIKYDPNCTRTPSQDWSNSSFIARTYFGLQTVDYLEATAIDDATGVVLTPGGFVLAANTGDAARIPFNQLLDFSQVDKSHVIRLDVTYYGSFPSSANGLREFKFAPFFEQLDKCTKVAIDYISAEIESVCMDKGAYCMGDYAVVNAAGFPRNADYRWQIQDPVSKEWSDLVINGIKQFGPQFNRISIPIKEVGKTHYRVYDNDKDHVTCVKEWVWDNKINQNVEVVKCDTVLVEFDVTGKDCDPTPIDSIAGDTIICVPTDSKGISMTVIPIDANENVVYHWELVGPDKQPISDKSIVYQETQNTRGTEIFLRLPGTAQEGDYVLTVYMTKEEEGVLTTVGSAVSKTVHVYRTPVAHFTIDGFINNGKDEICPSDNHQEIYATDNSTINPAHQYIYSWSHATSIVADGKTAIISWSAGAHDSLCAELMNKYTVGETVEIDGIGCKATWDTTLSVTKPADPVIDCDALGSKAPIEIILKANESFATVTLPVPVVTESCDRFPTVTIIGDGYDAAGNDLSFKIVANLDDMKNGKVAEMIRKFTATADAKGTNGVEVTYSVVDGCGKSSNICKIKYIIRDVTGPDVPCSDIPNYTTRLSFYNLNDEDGVDTCLAYPGEGSRPDLLPVLTEPVLTDQNGVDGKIKGEFVGRLDNQMTKPATSEALFKNSKIKLNDPVTPGISYILWKFADAVGNASYCMQTITVIDDKKPVVECPDQKIQDISVQSGTSECGLSTDSLLAKLNPASIPSAKEVCPKEVEILNSVLYYKESTSKTWIKIEDKSALLFKLGITYDIAWRFYKQNTGTTVDKDVYAECVRSFNVVDSVAPVVDCSILRDTAVTVNLSTEGKDLNYASASDARTFSYITYTLKGFFNMIPSAYDACSGEIRPTVSIITPDGKSKVVGVPADAEKKVLDAINKFQFPVGVSVLEYVYVDDKGNTSSCKQDIIVYERMAINCTSELTIPVDDKCLGHLDVTAATVNTALVSYVREYKYLNYNYMGTPVKYVDVVNDNDVYPGPVGPVGPAGPGAFGPGAFGPGAFGPAALPTAYGYYGSYVFKLDDSMTVNLSNRQVEVFPIAVKKVTNVDENGNATAKSVTETITNASPKEKLQLKMLQHRSVSYNFWTQKQDIVDYKNQVYKSITLQTKTFNKEFTDEFKTFEKGTHKLVWYYDNGQEKDSEDSCVVIVSVVDTTAPNVVCGEFGKDIVRASDPETCTAIVNLKQPTPEDVNATDNCTATSDIKVSFNRVFKGVTSTSLTDPFQQGTTVVTWIFADEDGNESYCIQNITVNDSTGPVVDCNKILVNPINVKADDKCQALKDVMVEAGLAIPVLDPSAELCSPTKDPIKGVGVREDENGVKDGLDVMNDPYALGHTIIVWTFTDSLGNATVCRQNIYVNDETGPNVDCKEFEENPINYELASDACEAPKDSILARLGTHKVKDNCDADSIAGVPYMLRKGGVRAPIPNAFVKDTTYIIEWVFTDKAGNESTCQQKFSVIDTTAPNNDICPDPEKSIDAKVSCTLTFDDLDLPELKINDLCDGELIGKLTGEVAQPGGKIVYPSSKEEFDALQYYAGTENYFTWTFTDHAGLTSTCKMKVTINDSIPPVINNCNTNNDATYEMSEGVCYAKWKDISKLIVIPVAFDECQDLIDGTGSTPIEPSEIRRYFDGQLVSVSTGSDTAWRADPFPRGVTRLVWVFTDRSGNVDSCAKSIRVVLRTDPSFICDSIQPNPMRPVAEEGTCSVFFKDLKFGKYYGFNACTNDSIEAKLLLGPVPSALPVPNDLEFKVGDTITVFWVVTDEDGNHSACPQIVIPSHSNPIDFDCNTLDTLRAVALEGVCYVPADQVNLPNPYAIDSCAQANGAKPDTIYAVPTRSDGAALNDNYPTGKTVISWMFVSPFNLNDTLICNQVVKVDGNKHFDLNCDVILPQINDTVTDCGPDPNIELTAPQVPDPCVEDTIITGVPVSRSDAQAIDAAFPLGTTVITWTFTEATGTITDTCRQNILVLTEKDLVKPCDTAAMDTILVPAPEDACTVPSSDVPLVRPYALHPCTFDTVWGVLSRPGVTDVNAPYVIGMNRLIWTFTDTTNTLVRPVGTCEQFVKVGDVEVEPVNCDNMPDINKVLAAGNCTIDFGDFELNIPPVIDRCPNGDPNGDPVEILPTITRASKPGWSTQNSKEIGTFSVGRDTITWLYVIAGNEYRCEQHISVKDSVEPDFDCSKLGLVLAEAEDGECEALLDAVLKLLQPYPKAVETCTGDSIEGVPTLEDGSPLPSSFKVGDTVIVKWTFIDTLVNTTAKICKQPVTVISNAEPIFDCNSLDTLFFVAHDACSIVLGEADIPVPVAKDSCTGADVPGVASRKDGGDVYGTYNTGFVTLTWTFDSPYSKKNKVCTQVVHVVTDLPIDGKCGEDNYPTIKVAVEDGVCEVPSTQILAKIIDHNAVNPCHNTWIIKGIPSRSDGKDLDENYPIGKTIITWTFTDTTQTLLNPVSFCEQIVEVGDNNEPPVDCEKTFPAVKRFLDADDCSIDMTEIPVYLNEMPVNKCNGDIAVLDTTRESGKLMSEPFEVGKDVIIWKFTFPSNNQTVVCRQNIEVIDTIAPNFDCNTLTPVINVAFKVAGVDYVTYDEVVAAGFYIPVVKDSCCEVKTTVTRSDNLQLEDNFKFGETVITFVFSDDHGNDKVCTQIIKVTDMVPPEETCPKIGGTYSCLSQIPQSFTYEEFVAAGGSLDDPSRADLTTFKVVDEVVGDSCEAWVYRNYHIESIRQDLVTCKNGPDTFYVKDNEAPTYVGISPVGESVNVACSDINYNVPNVSAVDNCDNNATVTSNFVSTQGADPSQCDYYTYDLIYSWVATDRCGNAAAPVSFTVHVKDTMAPTIHTPANWSESLHPVYLKNCRFGVPNITDLVPLDSVEMPCGGLEFLKIWQSPAAGTEITESVNVALHFTDVCGNDTVLYKLVEVQNRKDIIRIIADESAIVCGDDSSLTDPRGASNQLANTTIRKAKGETWAVDWDGSWVLVPTTVSWDYYRGGIGFDHLIYSDNASTYGNLFESIKYNALSTPEEKQAANEAYIKYLLLLRPAQSDDYYFVAMDTVSGCTDTAKVYIDVRERPRLNLASGVWNVCDGDSLAINGDFGAAFNVCVDNGGSNIISEGWIIGDTAAYVLNTPINYADGEHQKLVYYATNECGTTTTNHTLFTHCGEVLLNHADSLKVFGSEENVLLAKFDKYYASDSVDVKVYTHYDPAQVLLTTNPQDKARIWNGETADLILTLPYNPEVISWRRVEDKFDGTTGAIYDRYGNVISNINGERDDVDLELEEWFNRDTTVADSIYFLEHMRLNRYVYTIEPSDSSVYYAVVSNGVCPAVTSNLVSLDVVNELPTAITPYTKDGMNDDFMRGHHVIIFNRYGQMIFEGNDGWDGTYRGILADPGVYFYNCEIRNVVYKGSLEVVKIE